MAKVRKHIRKDPNDALETLNFEPSWYIYSMKYTKPVQWVAMHRHLHTDRKDGWLVHRGSKCSKCRIKFPTKLVGMLNMMNAFETRS